MSYLFGDSDIAEQRLRVLAEVFQESTRPFLLDTNMPTDSTVVDLGCGPGYSTHLLAKHLPCQRVVGMDNSHQFISAAEKTGTDKIEFRVHDVTTVPFPLGPCDLIFSRLLLAHLEDSQAVIQKWPTQLRPEGLILMEEVDWIETKHPIFSPYLEILEAVLRSQSNELYPGPMLDRLETIGPLKLRASGVRRLPVSNRQAATMFYMNVQTWGHNSYVVANYSRKVIEGLEEALKELAQRPDDTSDIEWGMRQVTFQNG
ncbi:MAG: class I SAM-dependent methyltransferase [Dehalococcoidia bacterium]